MILGIALLGASIEPASYMAERCAVAHRKLDKAAFQIQVDTKSLFSSEKTGYDLVYDRSGQADLTIRRQRPFRVIVTGDNVVEYDATTKQYAEKVKGQEDIDATVRRSAGNLDELVASLMNPAGVEHWIQSLKIGRLWTLKQYPGELVLANVVPESRTEIVLDPATFLLKRVVMKSNSYGTEWRFSKASVRPIAFAAPAGSYKVKELMPELVAPTYASAAAKRICDKVFARYDRPKNLAYLVTSGDETFQVWIDHGRVRQHDKESDWAVANGRFTLADQEQRLVSTGKADMTKIVDTVGKAGSRVEPMLKLLLRGINPFRLYLGQNSSVRVAGQMKANGESCSILEADSATGKLSMIVRESDGFVLSLATMPKGSEATSTRVFKPLPGGEDFVVSTPAGWTKKTLE